MKKNKIKLIRIAGPFGDATSDYGVIFPEDMTVLDFIVYILEEFPDEYGDFSVNWKDIVEYSRGTYKIINKELFDKVKNKKMLSIKANGGWTCMSYKIKTKEGVE